MKYTFYNRGSVTSFNPVKMTYGTDGKPVSMLEFHKELVRDANRRDVYITDQKGREVAVSLLQAA